MALNFGFTDKPFKIEFSSPSLQDYGQQKKNFDYVLISIHREWNIYPDIYQSKKIVHLFP